MNEKDHAEIQLAVVQGNEYVQQRDNDEGLLNKPRQGRKRSQLHLCCGCCCDTRKAVIVVNIISLCMASLAVLTLIVMMNAAKNLQVDDDEVQSVIDELDGAAVGMTFTIALVGIVCNIVGLIGAFTFQQIAILLSGLWYTAECIRSICYYDIGSAIMNILFAYPHCVFFYEINQGIVTSDNYANEEDCCNCCRK